MERSCETIDELGTMKKAARKFKTFAQPFLVKKLFLFGSFDHRRRTQT